MGWAPWQQLSHWDGNRSILCCRQRPCNPPVPVFIALVFTAKRNTSPTQSSLCYSYWNLEGAKKTPNLKQMSPDGSSGFVSFKDAKWLKISCRYIKEIYNLTRTQVFHTHASEMKKRQIKFFMTLLLLSCNIIFHYMIAYYFSHRMPASFSAQDAALDVSQGSDMGSTPPFAEVGISLASDHAEMHWVVQMWGKWLLWLLQLQSLVPHFPQTDLMHTGCVGVLSALNDSHRPSVSVQAGTEQYWSELISN